MMVSITAMGSVPHGCMVARTGIRPGDALYVTGTIGDSALGLQVRLEPGRFAALEHSAINHLLSRYLVPQPRLPLARALRELAHGGMDISDGFIGDLTKMAKASGVTASVALGDVPLSNAAKSAIAGDASLFETALTGGDDYELIVALDPGKCEAFEVAAGLAGITVSRVGQAEAGDLPPRFLDLAGAPVRFARSSYSHF